MSKALSITETLIESKIYLIRGQKVILDTDIAEMYGVPNKALKASRKKEHRSFS